jgi:predicted alpha/beta hydrolase family esterase
MPKQILVIHGGDAFEKYEDYLNYLKQREVTLDRVKSKDWKRNLGEVLGPEYEVLLPQMPNAQNARYLEWKIWFEKLIPLLNDSVIFVGHSLGGIFLAKYFSENEYPKQVLATYLVAAPYNTENDHPLVDFVISDNLLDFEKQSGEIFIYHSKDDVVVPFSNFSSYQKALPKAHTRIFENKQHFNQAEFPEIVHDIKSIT